MSGIAAAGARGARGRLVILESYPHLRGGAQRMAADLAGGLPAHGWTCEVIAPGDGVAIAALRAAGITVTELPGRASLHRYGDPRLSPRVLADLSAWWVGLARHLRRAGAHDSPTVLLASDQRGLVLSAAGARLARVPLVWHVHSAEDSKFLRRLGVLMAAAVVVPSPRTAARMPGRSTVVVPNGVTVPQPAPAALAGTPPALLTVGRLHPDKDLPTLLNAVAHLRSGRPTLTLSVVGDVQAGHEGYYEALCEQVRILGIDGVVTFVGEADQPFAQAHERTVFVQASRRETFGLALAEAMAMGLAVVATTTDGASELVEDGLTGLLVPIGDSNALAVAVDRLLGDEALAHRLGVAARDEITRRYSVEGMLAAEAALLDAVGRGR